MDDGQGIGVAEEIRVADREQRALRRADVLVGLAALRAGADLGTDAGKRRLLRFLRLRSAVARNLERRIELRRARVQLDDVGGRGGLDPESENEKR